METIINWLSYYLQNCIDWYNTDYQKIAIFLDNETWYKIVKKQDEIIIDLDNYHPGVSIEKIETVNTSGITKDNTHVLKKYFGPSKQWSIPWTYLNSICNDSILYLTIYWKKDGDEFISEYNYKENNILLKF